MKKLWFALLFFAGGLSHEIRHPVNCQCIASRHVADDAKKRGRN